MSKTIDRTPTPPWPGEIDDNHVAGFTRRSVLAGAAASAVVTIGADTPAGAQPADSDMVVFTKLSAALTGVAHAKLAPGVDPVNVKEEYFRQVSNAEYAAAFTALLQLTRAANLQIPAGDTDDWPGVETLGGVIPQDKVDALAGKIEERDDTKFLARSIVLMWYLGAWYEPDDLKKIAANPKAEAFPTIISPKAYTQGWLWRVAQAHPMGYSDMQFGYWTRPPEPPAEFIAVVKAKGN
jgi:hypothetical protein